MAAYVGGFKVLLHFYDAPSAPVPPPRRDLFPERLRRQLQAEDSGGHVDEDERAAADIRRTTKVKVAEGRQTVSDDPPVVHGFTSDPANYVENS